MSDLEIIFAICAAFSWGMSVYLKRYSERIVSVNSQFGYGKINLRDKYPQFTLDKEAK